MRTCESFLLMRMPRLLAHSLVAVGLLGCSHTSKGAATAEQALDLMNMQLADRLQPELARASMMLAEELAVAHTWAKQGRNRELLAVLAATADNESASDLHPRCARRFAGDGWAMLCSKLAQRLEKLGGYEVPFVTPRPVTQGRAAPPSPAAQEASRLHTALEGLRNAWHGPERFEVEIDESGTELELLTQERGKSPQMAPVLAGRCPSRPIVTTDPRLAEGVARHSAACAKRRGNLLAAKAAAGGEIGEAAEQAMLSQDTLVAYDMALTVRKVAFAEVRGPCAGEASSKQPCSIPRVLMAFKALDAVPVQKAALKKMGFEALGFEGRVLQLSAQLAALDQLIAVQKQADGLKKLKELPLALALHQTIDGIEQIQAKLINPLDPGALTLIRETLRIERAGLIGAMGRAERQRQIALARLGAQLDEYTLLVDGFVAMQHLTEPCTNLSLVLAQRSDACNDDATKVLQSLADAWTIGRSAQRQADALARAVRHEASIDRVRGAMAMREIHLAAGVAELVNLNKGGIDPDMLALLIVNAVGFGTVTAGVY